MENSKDFLPFMISDFPDNILLKAKQELGENDISIKEGLSQLRQFIRKKDLPHELDDELLLKFLRVTKYNISKSEEKLFNYCTLRRKKYDYVEDLDEKVAEDIIDRKIMGILPYRDRHGRVIAYGISSNWDPDICDMMDLFRCIFALVHFALSFPATCVSGCISVSDARVQRFSHYFHFMRCFKNHLVDLLSMPIRFQKIHGIYFNSLSRFIYSLVQSIIPTKLSSRVHLHKEGFVDDVSPPSILPYEFNGTMGELSNDHFKKEFILFIRKFKSENSIFLKRNGTGCA